MSTSVASLGVSMRRLSTRIGCAFGDDEPLVTGACEHRRDLAFVVEGEPIERVPCDGVVGIGWGRVPESAVEFVAGAIAACQPKVKHPTTGAAVGRERVGEADLAVGEGAGLVGEEHADVAEIFDADESFDDHVSLGETAAAGGKADRNDRSARSWGVRPTAIASAKSAD